MIARNIHFLFIIMCLLIVGCSDREKNPSFKVLIEAENVSEQWNNWQFEGVNCKVTVISMSGKDGRIHWIVLKDLEEQKIGQMICYWRNTDKKMELIYRDCLPNIECQLKLNDSFEVKDLDDQGCSIFKGQRDR